MRGHLEQSKKIQDTINAQKAYGAIASSNTPPTEASPSTPIRS